MKSNNNKIGLLGAISIGVGGMVGGGIFAVLGEAVSLGHGATGIAFLFAGIVALLTSYSYAKLSVAMPSRGGTIVFIDKAFGHNLLSGTCNVILWLSYLVTIALYAVAFASYGETFFSANTIPYLHQALIITAIVVPLIINLVSAQFVGKSETMIVFIKVTLLLAVILLSIPNIDPSKINVKSWSIDFSLLVAGMIIFVAYEGFELIANAAEDIENPKINLPIAYYTSVIFVIILYISIAFVTVGTVPFEQLIEAKDYALAFAAKPSLGQWGFIVVAIAALLSTFSAINATIYGNARLGFTLAKEGELPQILTHEQRTIPTVSSYVTVLLSSLLALTIDINEIAIIASASFLVIFFVVNIAACKLHQQIGGKLVVHLTASVVSLIALIVLLAHSYQQSAVSTYVFVSFIAIAFIFELTYGFTVRKHIFNRKC